MSVHDIRDTTPREFGRLSRGMCPKCTGTFFQPGPRGGAAQNVECTACGWRFNVTIHGGVLIFAQVIGRRPLIDDWQRYREQLPETELAIEP